MDIVIGKLNQWLEEIRAELRGDPKNIALHEQASQIELAIQNIRLCEKYGILPKSIIRRLPEQQIPTSDYRVVEDLETNRREYWVEVRINGEPLRLNEGDLVIQP